MNRRLGLRSLFSFQGTIMRVIGSDTETGLIIPGNVCPPLVCLSRAERGGDSVCREALLDRHDAVSWFRSVLQDETVCTIWMNGPYDWSVLVEEADDPELLELVFDALRTGRLSDIETREKLLLNEVGELREAEDDDSGRGIPLYSLVWKYLQIDIKSDKKDPDAWRLRYHELRDVPLDLWPEKAVTYAQDDAVLNVLVYEAQQRQAASTDYLDVQYPWLITDERRKVTKKFAMRLMGAWGVRTNPEQVHIFAKAVEDGMRKIEHLVLTEGLARTETKKGVVEVTQNRRVIQDRVALSYAWEALGLDAREERRKCVSAAEGTDKTPEQVGLESLGESVVGLPSVWPKTTNPEGGGKAVFVDGICTTPLTEPSSRFPQGQVSYARLTLLQSADDALILLGQQGEVQKLSSTYVPILSQGVEVPINAVWNEMVSSGRSSCRRPNLQNLPTFGLYRVSQNETEYLCEDEETWTTDVNFAGSWTGRRSQALADKHKGSKTASIGGLRSCFVPREGWVLLDADIDFAECVAWSQWCLDVLGVSDMGEVINSGEDPHIHLAITFPILKGWSYAEATKARKSNPDVKHARDRLAKAGNFGRMGGMSAETMLLFALNSGSKMTLEEAQMVIDAFDTRWRESRLSSSWVSKRTANDSRFVFVQPRSLRRRGGCGYTTGKNQPLQGGTADHADDVLSCLSYECYTGKVYNDRTKHSPLYGARPWNFSHDEFILEIPYETWGPDRGHEAACRLEHIVIERGQFWFPDIVTRTEAAMAREWLKDRKAGVEFKRVLDSQGRVIPQ